MTYSYDDTLLIALDDVVATTATTTTTATATATATTTTTTMTTTPLFFVMKNFC